MKSFRLDGESVAAFLESWPALLVGALLGGLFVYFGLAHLWGVVAGVLLFGIYGGYLLRGVASKRLQKALSQRPMARAALDRYGDLSPWRGDEDGLPAYPGVELGPRLAGRLVWLDLDVRRRESP